MSSSSPIFLRSAWLRVPLILAGVAAAAFVLTDKLYGQPLIAAGLAYAILFMALAWYHPSVALALVIAGSPFQEDVGGGGPAKFSIAEVNLALCALVTGAKLLPRGRWPDVGPLALPMALLFAVSLAASVGRWTNSTTVSILQMALYLWIVPATFANLPDPRETFRRVLMTFVAVGLVFAVAGAASGSGFVFGVHKNGVGGSVAAALVVAAELWLGATQRGEKRLAFWLMAAAGVMGVGLLITLSRGGWLAAGVGTLVLFAFRGKWSLMVKLGLVMVPLIALVWFTMPEEHREYATGFSAKRENIKARWESVEYALDRFKENPAIGVGVGLRKDYDATNVYLATLAETGVVGLAAFLFFHAAIFSKAWALRRHIPPDSPLASLPALAVALVLGRLAHGTVDHFWSRGAIMVAYAAVGMFLFARKRVAAGEFDPQPLYLRPS